MTSQPEHTQSASDNQDRQRSASESVASPPTEVITDTKSDFPRPHWKKSAEVTGIVLLIAGTVLGLRVWFEDRIDKAVEKKLSEPAILRKIAAQSRPALIFDGNESITADMGAGQLVKRIHVTQRDTNGWPQNVTVDFSCFLANPPILTSLHDVTSVFAKRAQGFAWRFEIQEIIEHGKEKDAWLYRLELAP